MDCNINIFVFLFLTVFDMGTNQQCDNNYLEITDLDTNSIPVKFCGTDHPANHQGKTSRVSVRYKKQSSFSGTGWLINFMAVHENADISSIEEYFRV